MNRSFKPASFTGMAIILIALAVICVNCQDKSQHRGKANAYMHKNKIDDLVKRFESPERAKWQKPEWVIEKMGALQGKTVVEIGAGTGYFSFRLLDKAQKVIAADVDQRFLDYIEKKKKTLSSSSIQQLNTRLIPYDDPKIKQKEADWVLMVNVYHHIENRDAYLKKLRGGLNKGGKVMIVDFKKGDLPKGPPDEIKLSPDEVVDELRKSGFQHFQIIEELDYQYIIIAQDKPE